MLLKIRTISTNLIVEDKSVNEPVYGVHGEHLKWPRVALSIFHFGMIGEPLGETFVEPMQSSALVIFALTLYDVAGALDQLPKVVGIIDRAVYISHSVVVRLVCHCRHLLTIALLPSSTASPALLLMFQLACAAAWPASFMSPPPP
jgi:hypothetical protein